MFSKNRKVSPFKRLGQSYKCKQIVAKNIYSYIYSKLFLMPCFLCIISIITIIQIVIYTKHKLLFVKVVSPQNKIFENMSGF